MTDKKTTAELAEVCAAFKIGGELTGYEINPTGNINTTYKVVFLSEDGTEKFYILQKINTYVFKNPLLIMNNIDHVTEHIRAKGLKKPSLHFHHTASGANYYSNSHGCFWRLCNYIDSMTFDICGDPQILRRAGQAFGDFQMQLSDFDASKLHETIPAFHNTEKRLDKLFTDVLEDTCGRAASVRDEIEYIDSLRPSVIELGELLNRREIPLRVTHNDTKVNNVLFDRNTREPLTVIDLDTVMPGLTMHDFGDAVRSAANTAAEDERNLSAVRFDLNLYRAFADGFIGRTAGALTDREIETMALGALTITVELASRFLDDYLIGDKYFKINYAEHNVDRARCQLRLARDMVFKFGEMRSIVKEITAKSRGQYYHTSSLRPAMNEF